MNPRTITTLLVAGAFIALFATATAQTSPPPNKRQKKTAKKKQQSDIGIFVDYPKVYDDTQTDDSIASGV